MKPPALSTSAAPPRALRAGRGGFTLVELLAAMAVFVLMIAMLSQIFNNTIAATQVSRHQLDASQQNRLVVEALRNDLANMVVLEGGATIWAQPQPTSSRLMFLTRSRGPEGAANFRFLAVAYIQSGNTLVRKSAPVTWDDQDLMQAAAAATSNASGDNTLTDSILRFQVMLNLDNGETVPLSVNGPWKSAELAGASVPEGYFALNLAGQEIDPASPRVKSLSVAVAAVDSLSLRLPGAENMGDALGQPATGQTYEDAWNAVINGGGLSNFPQPAVGALRVNHATFPLNP